MCSSSIGVSAAKGVGRVVEGPAEEEAAGMVGDSDDRTTGWGFGRGRVTEGLAKEATGSS